MIKHISIKNYRSIRNFETKLSPRINVFIGPTDSGKSNIIRAIRDACFNASGNDFVTIGQKSSSVALDLVKWTKGNKISLYRIGNEKYHNVGRSILKEATDALNIREISWGDAFKKKINFIEQFEPKFFLSYPESTNARILGYISGINDIFITVKNLLKKKKELAKEISIIRGEYIDCRTQLLYYDDVEELKLQLNKLNKVVYEYEQYSKLKLTIEDAINQKKQLKDRLKDINEVVEEKIDIEHIEKIESRIQKLNELVELRQSKRILIDEKKEKINSITQFKRELSEIKKELDSYLDSTNICPLTKSKFYSTCKRDILNND